MKPTRYLYLFQIIHKFSEEKQILFIFVNQIIETTIKFLYKKDKKILKKI